MERLLAELDARAAMRFPGPYLMERPPARRHVIWLRALWAALWVMSIILCVFVVKYFDRGPPPRHSILPKPAPSTSWRIPSATRTRQFARMIDSVETLANSVASSSIHTTAMQSVLRRLGHDLSQAADTPPKRPAAPDRSPLSPPASGAGARTAARCRVIDGRSPPRPHRRCHCAEERHRPSQRNGVMDYWLMPRLISGSRSMIRVFPVAQTNLGIFVHSFDEVRDYVVTPSGDWLAASGPHGVR